MSDLATYPTLEAARRACPEGYVVIAEAQEARVFPNGMLARQGFVRYYVMPEQVRDYVQFLEHKAVTA